MENSTFHPARFEVGPPAAIGGSTTVLPARLPAVLPLGPVNRDAKIQGDATPLPAVVPVRVPVWGERPSTTDPPGCDLWAAVPSQAASPLALTSAIRPHAASTLPLRMPALAIVATGWEHLESGSGAAPAPPICESWMPSPAPAAVMRSVTPEVRGAIPGEISLQLPRLPGFAIGELRVEPCAEWMTPPAAEVVSMLVTPRAETENWLVPRHDAGLPAAFEIEAADDAGLSQPGTLAEPMGAIAPAPLAPPSSRPISLVEFAAPDWVRPVLSLPLIAPQLPAAAIRILEVTGLSEGGRAIAGQEDFVDGAAIPKLPILGLPIEGGAGLGSADARAVASTGIAVVAIPSRVNLDPLIAPASLAYPGTPSMALHASLDVPIASPTISLPEVQGPGREREEAVADWVASAAPVQLPRAVKAATPRLEGALRFELPPLEAESTGEPASAIAEFVPQAVTIRTPGIPTLAPSSPLLWTLHAAEKLGQRNGAATPRIAGETPVAVPTSLPGTLAVRPASPMSQERQTSDLAAVKSPALPVAASAPLTGSTMRLPGNLELDGARPAEGTPVSSEPQPADLRSNASARPPATPEPRLPEVLFARPLAVSHADFRELWPVATVSQSIARAPQLKLMAREASNPREELPKRPHPAIPNPGFIPTEFYCQRGGGSPRPRVKWVPRTIAPMLPSLSVRVAVDRTDEPVTRPPEKTESTYAEIFSLPEGKKYATNRALGHIAKVAACLLVALLLWVGGHAVKVAAPTMVSNRDVSSAHMTGSPENATERPEARPAAPAPNDNLGTMARVRNALATRATLEVSDSFHAGMEAWGSGSRSMAPGWSRNPDGYVRTGDLALFRPSLSFANYRLEFFGQIESKSLGWVVRARDKQNYYAMKFTVVQGGLRPIIAIAHYPVVDGRKGHKTEVPLSTMMHANTPFHVSVDVQGKRFTASIEGQRVDSWTDDAAPAGAVGFFSEAGEHARIYWMKVTKNDDFLGMICGFLAGGGPQQTAEMWNPAMPLPSPRRPAPHLPEAMPAAETEISFDGLSASREARISKYRRTRPWSS